MRGALFVWIPKTAGSSISQALNLTRYVNADDLDQFKNKGQVTFGHMPPADLIRSGVVTDLFARLAFKFTFIRNPYDRAVSLYEYSRKIRLIPENWSFLKTVKHVRDKGVPRPGLYKSQGLSQWNTQSSFIGDFQFDFIGRVERIGEDFADLCTKLGVAARDLQHRNASVREGGHYSYYYSTESRTYVEELYSEDLMRFNYMFEENGHD